MSESTCWKCGEPVPAGQTECEDCASGGGEALALELSSGQAAALAIHLHTMSAERCEIPVTVNDVRYRVIVELVSETGGGK